VPKQEFSEDLATEFRLAKQKAVESSVNGKEIFSWTLHDEDDRGVAFQHHIYDAWTNWLSWYKYHHFQWNRLRDSSVQDLQDKIVEVGKKTWKTLFKKYTIPIL
jgi:hypothetical protein